MRHSWRCARCGGGRALSDQIPTKIALMVDSILDGDDEAR